MVLSSIDSRLESDEWDGPDSRIGDVAPWALVYLKFLNPFKCSFYTVGSV